MLSIMYSRQRPEALLPRQALSTTCVRDSIVPPRSLISLLEHSTTAEAVAVKLRAPTNNATTHVKVVVIRIPERTPAGPRNCHRWRRSKRSANGVHGLWCRLGDGD